MIDHWNHWLRLLGFVLGYIGVSAVPVPRCDDWRSSLSKALPHVCLCIMLCLCNSISCHGLILHKWSVSFKPYPNQKFFLAHRC